MYIVYIYLHIYMWKDIDRFLMPVTKTKMKFFKDHICL